MRRWDLHIDGLGNCRLTLYRVHVVGTSSTHCGRHVPHLHDLHGVGGESGTTHHPYRRLCDKHFCCLRQPQGILGELTAIDGRRLLYTTPVQLLHAEALWPRLSLSLTSCYTVVVYRRIAIGFLVFHIRFYRPCFIPVWLFGPCFIFLAPLRCASYRS